MELSSLTVLKEIFDYIYNVESEEETLGMAWGFEPLHALLPLAGGLVGVLCTIIEIPASAMFYPWEDLSLGGSVAFKFIRDGHSEHIG